MNTEWIDIWCLMSNFVKGKNQHKFQINHIGIKHKVFSFVNHINNIEIIAFNTGNIEGCNNRKEEMGDLKGLGGG